IGEHDLPREPRFASDGARVKHIPEIVAMMREWFARRPFDDAVKALSTHDVPYAPIMSIADLFADPHVREREMIGDVPADGLGTLAQRGVVPKLSLTPGRVTHAGPPLGRHTDEVLKSLLGMPAGEIAALRAEGVI